MNSTVLNSEIAAPSTQEVLQKLADRLINKRGYVPQIPITYEDLASLTPGQIDQADRIAAYSRNTAVRYIASITRPEELSVIVASNQKKKAKKKENPPEKSAYNFQPWTLKVLRPRVQGGGGEKDSHNSALLLVSPKVREIAMTRISEPLVLLNRVKKQITPYIWDGREFLTTEQVAQYYGIPANGLRRILCLHKEEMEFAGVETVRGTLAVEAKQVAGANHRSGRLTLWTPRAAVRVGLLIYKSDIAIHLRKVLAAGCRV